MKILFIIRKSRDKFKEKGLRGFLVVVFGKVQRTWRRFYFRNVGRFFECFGVFKVSHQFRPQAIGDISLENYPFEEVFQQINSNQYQILEGKIRSWGRSANPGELIWNQDIVQGYEWPSDRLGIELPIPFNKGDIKRPWELGRLHQLVQLGLCFRASHSQDKKAQIVRLATDIFHDFSKMNPKFQGPQWMCAMDVGIRLANICLAASILGDEFVSKNQKLLNYELARHLFFIETNLENSLGSTVANHYFADLCGLVFGYAHSSGWRSLGKLKRLAKTIQAETLRQFCEDGGNFEGSSYYHRLSGEFALFSFLYLGIKLGKTKAMPSNLKDRLFAMKEFSLAISRQDGVVPQIGDNDSGHLFIFDPIQFQKDDLSHLGFIRGMEKFLAGSLQIEPVIDAFNGGVKPNPLLCSQSQAATYGSESDFLNAQKVWESAKNIQRYSFGVSQFEVSELKLFSFDKFGIFLAKSESIYFYVRCGVSAQDDGGGHRHRDQLSIYIFDGQDIVGRDPGSYLYTSDVEMRNLLRSSQSHNGPYLGAGRLSEKSLFEMEDQSGRCLYFGKLGFLGESREGGEVFNRWISFSNSRIEIVDWSLSGRELPRIDFNQRFFSNRYGSLMEHTK